MATFYKISMQDGRKEDLTLNLGALAELSKKKKDVSDRYFELYKKMQTNEGITEIEMGEIIYIAYACAHVNDEIMTLTDFLYDLTDNRKEIADVFQQLFGMQKKKQGSVPHSRKQRRR